MAMRLWMAISVRCGRKQPCPRLPSRLLIPSADLRKVTGTFVLYNRFSVLNYNRNIPDKNRTPNICTVMLVVGFEAWCPYLATFNQ